MLRALASSLGVVTCACCATGQEPAIEWQGCLGGSGPDYWSPAARATPDGGMVVSASTYSTDGDVSGWSSSEKNFWVVKLDGLGSIAWERVLGGSENDDPYTLDLTHAGGYVVAGTTLSNDIDVTGNHGYYDAWVVELDGDGDIVWQRTFGGSEFECVRSVKQTLDGGYVFCGRANSIDGDVVGNHGGGDAWVVKLDALGAIQWQRCLGGAHSDYANSILPTSDGGYVMAGETHSVDGDVQESHGGYDGWVVKLDHSGYIEWETSLGGSDWEHFSGVCQAEDGGYIVAGATESIDGDVVGLHEGGYDMWVVKLDVSGVLQWQATLGGTDSEQAKDVAPVAGGGYAVLGDAQSDDGDVVGLNGSTDFWVVKLTDSGVIEWQKPLGGVAPDHGFAIDACSNGDLVLCGYSNSNNGDVSGNHGSTDVWVVRLGWGGLGFPEIDVNVLEACPNPSSGIFGVSFPVAVSDIFLYDSLGRLVFSQSVSAPSFSLDMNAYPSGTYNLHALGCGQHYVKALVVQ